MATVESDRVTSARRAIDGYEFCLTPPHQLDADNLAILRDEEDEPDFSAIIKRAQARADQSGEDGQLIRDLLSVIAHYDNTLDSYFWNMGDHGELPEGA